MASDYKRGRRRITFSASTDAPVGGLNTRDSPSRRGPSYADKLTNWVVTPNGVEVRKGFRQYATGLPGLVETLMPYNAETGANKLFAASGSVIADVTNPGTAVTTGASTQAGLTSARWSFINFTGAISHYLVICNGVDPARHWDGSQWVVWTKSDTPGIGQVGGIEPSKFESVISHQKRLWFVEANSTRGWYLPVNSLGGGAVSFDFGPLFPRGGKLVALASWSMNGGTGMQNMLVAISSSGDTVIYQGTDPSDATKWTIQGTWSLGAPVGNQCFKQFGGDTLLLSRDGLVPLSKFMQTTTTTPALTDTIRNLVTALLTSQNGLPGFQIHDYLTENILLVNVPQINPLQNFQFVFNTVTGGWSLFNGLPAQCWANLGDQVFFGGYQTVYQAFSGYKDNANYDGSGGSSYNAICQQSQFTFEKPGEKKRFVRARVNIQSAVGRPDILIGCNVDYDQTPPENTNPVFGTDLSAWDSGRWDNATWGAATLTITNEWSTLGKIGYSGAIVLSVSVEAETVWISTDWEIELSNS